MVLVLFESPLGYTLFKLKDAGVLQKPESLRKSSGDSSNLGNLLSLSAISRFASTAEGVEEISSIQEGKLSKTLKKFLVDEVQGGDGKKKSSKAEQLVVSDPKLGQSVVTFFSLLLSVSLPRLGLGLCSPMRLNTAEQE